MEIGNLIMDVIRVRGSIWGEEEGWVLVVEGEVGWSNECIDERRRVIWISGGVIGKKRWRIGKGRECWL